VPEAEALKFVTLNPAIQLGIAARVRSLEPGKDADFVVWSGHPLSTYSLCEQTWIDGRRYFDRAADLERRQAVAAERAALLARARAGDAAGKVPAKPPAEPDRSPEKPEGVDPARPPAQLPAPAEPPALPPPVPPEPPAQPPAEPPRNAPALRRGGAR
jgi:hypothetical protein